MKTTYLSFHNYKSPPKFSIQRLSTGSHYLEIDTDEYSIIIFLNNENIKQTIENMKEAINAS